jgi:hypothetical protein
MKTLMHDLQFEVDRKDRVITLPIPNDSRERSDFGRKATRAVDARFMPPGAEPQDGWVRLTDNRSRS